MDAVFVPIPGAYSVSFKKRRSGRLRHILVRQCQGVVDASRQARARVAELGWDGYREYGVAVHKEMHCPVEFWGSEGHGIDWREGGFEHWRPLVRQEFLWKRPT